MAPSEASSQIFDRVLNTPPNFLTVLKSKIQNLDVMKLPQQIPDLLFYYFLIPNTFHLLSFMKYLLENFSVDLGINDFRITLRFQ